ncbi:MAG TPA: TolC family protein [Terriglobales bacterium]|nr:TolC family protein [Terriglobales bacterium]
MNKSSLGVAALALLGTVGAAAAGAQAPQPFTLAQAQALALQHRPRLQAAVATAQAAAQNPRALRSVYFPQLSGDLTGVGAETNSRIAAGGLNNPVIYSRYANGLSLSQLVTDFGHTANLVKSSRLDAQARQQDTLATRAQVLLQVDQSYYGALQAQAVLRVAQQAVQERQLIAHQVGVLEKNKLRSTLDVSFAQVNLAQAQLLLSQARAEVKSSFADLALALGTALPPGARLQDGPLPATPPADVTPLVAEALRHRPELASAGLELSSAQAYAQAERDLWRPTVSAVASAGLTPTGAQQLPDRYAAAGINLSLPLFNGGLFAARRIQANYQADATQRQMQELENQITHDVQVAWLKAQTAQEQLGLTQELERQATLAMHLAQSRYRLGLGSIVELSQAQLNQTQADIAQAQAKYQFQMASDDLDFQLGRIR